MLSVAACLKALLIVVYSCAALAFCHSIGVAHRDIKPENVLLTASSGLADLAETNFYQHTTLKHLLDEFLLLASGSSGSSKAHLQRTKPSRPLTAGPAQLVPENTPQQSSQRCLAGLPGVPHASSAWQAKSSSQREANASDEVHPAECAPSAKSTLHSALPQVHPPASAFIAQPYDFGAAYVAPSGSGSNGAAVGEQCSTASGSRIHSQVARTPCGSENFCSPEIAFLPSTGGSLSALVELAWPADAYPQRLDRQTGYDPFATDVWSFGVTIFKAVSGRKPFLRATITDAYFRGFVLATQPHTLEDALLNPRSALWARGQPHWTWPCNMSLQLRQLVAACTRVRPHERPTMQQLLQHPWFKVRQSAAQQVKFQPSQPTTASSTTVQGSASAQEASASVLPCSRQLPPRSSPAPTENSQSSTDTPKLHLPPIASSGGAVVRSVHAQAHVVSPLASNCRSTGGGASLQQPVQSAPCHGQLTQQQTLEPFTEAQSAGRGAAASPEHSPGHAGGTMPMSRPPRSAVCQGGLSSPTAKAAKGGLPKEPGVTMASLDSSVPSRPCMRTGTAAEPMGVGSSSSLGT